MKIAVIGANGKAGTLVVREATERGHEVTAIMRSEHSSQAQHTLIKDVFALTRSDLSGFDAVVDASAQGSPSPSCGCAQRHPDPSACYWQRWQPLPRLDHGSAACRLARHARRIQAAGYCDGAGV